jgi:hypothetical protein
VQTIVNQPFSISGFILACNLNHTRRRFPTDDATMLLSEAMQFFPSTS